MTSINTRQLVISIATLLRSRFTVAAVATSLALILAVRVGLPFYRHHEAINAVKRMGGRCIQKWSRSPILAMRSLNIRPDDFMPVDVIELGSFVRHARLTEDDMRLACQLSQVERMEIYCDRCDAACLAPLQNLPGLRTLVIRCREIDERGLRALAELSSLKSLDFDAASGDKSALEDLKRRLKVMWLRLEVDVDGTESADQRESSDVTQN